jgi:hypothetical protein
MYLLALLQAADTLSHTQQAALILLEGNKFSGGRHLYLDSKLENQEFSWTLHLHSSFPLKHHTSNINIY